MLTDEELKNLAKEELLRDARSAAVRAELYGAHRWARPKLMIANKRFLKHMILNGKKDVIRKNHSNRETDGNRDKAKYETQPDNRTDHKMAPSQHRKSKDESDHHSEPIKRKHHNYHHHRDDDKNNYKKKKEKVK